MGKGGNLLTEWGLVVTGVMTIIAAAIFIRTNIQIAVVVCVFLFLAICFMAIFRFHTRKQGGIPFTSEKIKYRKWGGYLLLLPFITIIIFLLIPRSAAYIQTAILGTPTPTPEPTATHTPTATEVQVNPAATGVECYCQKATDDLTIQCLITAESQAANEGSLDLISKIFSPNATIFRANDPQQTWETPLEYYQQSFGDFTFTSARHFDVAYKGAMGKTEYYVSGSAGYYQKNSGGAVESYNNVSPSEHWAFTKNEQGCWAVSYYEFNAAHLPFPAEK